jgi:phosphotransferase system IIB component
MVGLKLTTASRYDLTMLRKEYIVKASIKASMLGIALVACMYAAHSAEDVKKLDTAQIEQITGLKGKYSQEENVFKVVSPRTDVKIEVDQWKMSPFMGLTSWAAFTPANDGQVMMMGDTVVFEDEVNAAMSAAFDAGLEVTALHNHFFFDKPKVYFMHIGGMGEESQLAQGVKKVYDKIAEIRKANPIPTSNFPQTISPENKITADPLEKILGVKGESKNGMFKVTIGRPAMMHGTRISKEMGVNTWAAFAGTDSQAVVDGDFAMLESEMQPVLKAMRKDGISIVAIHQHMTQDEPHYLFMHYWGKGSAQDLAKAVKKALDTQASAKQQANSDQNWFQRVVQKTVGFVSPNFLPDYCLSPTTRLRQSDAPT